MPVELSKMRELLLPGLQELAASSAVVKRFQIFGRMSCPLPASDLAPLPSVPLPVAVAMGAAAVVMKNPVVKRRFWAK